MNAHAKKAASFCKNSIKQFSGLFYTAPFRFSLISSFILVIIVEALCRHSFFSVFEFMFTHPLMFLSAWVIILFTISFSWFMKKGIVMWFTASIVWFGLALTNCIIKFYRAAPLTGSDFVILDSVLPIIGVYLNVFQIILCAVGIFGAIALIVLLWIKTAKREINFKLGLTRFLALTITLAIIIPCFFIFDIFPKSFSDINKAYDEYGFPYGFLCSIFVHGIDKPDGYGKESIDAILDRIDEKKNESGSTESDPEIKPNVIYVQLESFFDINTVKKLSVSEDVIPNFSSLKKNYLSGYLSVPLVGAGTANTEFEILTSMDLDFFGAGEYPYTSVLEDDTCESAAYIYSNYGYKTHAIHNNTGTFYDRNIVYGNLGFDTFSPIECLYNVEYNPLNWATDACLKNQIIETLNSTEERDFIFTVSVQAHGKYPTEMLGDPSDYKYTYDDIDGLDSEELENMYLYYINQIKGTDDFIGTLIDYLSDFEEPTVVVFYGDHLPFLELEAEDVECGDLYRTEYILWSNYDLGIEDTDGEMLEAYQLSSMIYGLLGFDGGVMSDLHTYLRNEEDYLELIETIEYDLLFGDKYAYGEKGGYKPKEITFGIRSVSITDIAVSASEESEKKLKITVRGKNYNPFSKICVNGEEADETFYVSENELYAVLKLSVGDVITVVQQASDGTVFVTTDAWTVTSID